MKSHIVTPQAEADILDIADFISQDSVESALRVIDQLEAAFHFLGTNPGSGHFREDILGRQYRFWTVYSYLIVYRWQASPIQILAVVHSSRNLGPYFENRGLH